MESRFSLVSDCIFDMWIELTLLSKALLMESFCFDFCLTCWAVVWLVIISLLVMKGPALLGVCKLGEWNHKILFRQLQTKILYEEIIIWRVSVSQEWWFSVSLLVSPGELLKTLLPIFSYSDLIDLEYVLRIHILNGPCMILSCSCVWEVMFRREFP